MKFTTVFYMILLTVSLGLITSCDTDTKQKQKAKISKVKSKKSKQKATKKGKKAPKTIDWKSIQKKAGINNKTLNTLKSKINAYNTQIAKLKKQGKWTGKANEKTRTKLIQKRKTEVKAILGKKYDAYIKALNSTKNTKKPAAKKKPISKKN